MTHHARHETATFLGFAGGVFNPEDLVALPGTPWIVVSAMRVLRDRGALFAIDREGTTPAFEIPWAPAAEVARRPRFDPHGIDVRRRGDGRFELLVVDHGEGEAIDRLTVDASEGRPRIVAGERTEQPAGTSGNAVAFEPGGGFVVTSMFDPRDDHRIEKFAAGAPTGAVWRWTATDGWTRIGPALSGANGIAVSPDGAFIVVSEWSRRCVHRLARTGEVEATVAVDFLPDNVRWTRAGQLLLAGQNTAPEALFGCEARGEPCPLACSVVELDPATMQVRPLVQLSDDEAHALGFGGATGALEVDDVIWLGTFTGERIARFALRL